MSDNYVSPSSSIAIGQWLTASAEVLSDISDSARLDAELLLGKVLEKERTYFFTWPEKTLNNKQLEAVNTLLHRRLTGEPVAYIIGEREFWSLVLYTDPSTLIPRPDTEVLVEKALSLLPQTPCRILDLGTGTGAIALALASERKDCAVDAVDFSAEAVALAERNRTRHALDNVSVFASDWFSNVQRKYDLIVSNPPYIDAEDHHLNEGDVVFEPRSALIADEEGLADIRHIASHGLKYLNEHGWLLVEHGWQQGKAVQDIFVRLGYQSVSCIQDYGSNDRVTLGKKGGE